MANDGTTDAGTPYPLTPEEIELLHTPSQEIEKRTKVFSFDRERFRKRIFSGERWQKLLQAHLYYDHVITQLLVESLANPDAIEATRLGFVQKIQLIRALGLLPSDLAATVEFVNSLRNKIAHRLDFEIGDDVERDLINCTPKSVRDVLMRQKRRVSGPLKFSEVLMGVLYLVDILRQQHAFRRVEARKADIRLRAALNNLAIALDEPLVRQP